MSQVSFYPKITKAEATDGQLLDLATVLAGIQVGQWAAPVATVRAALTKAERDALKKKLPYFTASGTFVERKKTGLLVHSGLLCLDIDADANPDVDLLAKRAAVEADAYTYACATSTGGVGFFVLVPIPTDDHLGSFYSLARYYREHHGLAIDEACKDVCRARFVSHDPALHLNAQAEQWQDVEGPPAPKALPSPAAAYPAPAVGGSYGQQALLRCCEKVADAPEKQKHYTLNKMAYLCGGYVASGFLAEGEARQALQDAIGRREVADLKAAFRTIEDGLRDGQQKPVLPDWLQYSTRHELRKKQQDFGTVVALATDIANRARVPLAGVQAAVQAMADEQANAPHLCTFWDVFEPTKRDGPKKLQLNMKRFCDWLGQAGFCKHASAPTGIVRVVAGVVHPVEVDDLIEHVKAYLRTLPAEFDDIHLPQLEELLHRQHRTMYDPQGLLYLDPLQGEFLRDTARTAYAFFRNCWVEVTAAGRKWRDYADLPGLIPAAAVRAFDFAYTPDEAAERCDFHAFTQRVTGDEPERLQQLQRALGYLIHGYKDVTNARAVVLMDAVGEVGKSSGGTGKGLLLSAVGELVEVCLLDGRTFDLKDPFRYEEVTDTARVVFFDEWHATRNPFENLFSTITGPLPVNRKYQAKKSLPFADAPKFAIATNEVVTGDDDSSARRKVEVALAKRYSAAYTPKDEFGTAFFGEHWDCQQYNRFYNLALSWVQQYLAHGLLLLKDERIAARGLVQELGVTFHEFAVELRAQLLTERAEAQAAGKLPHLLWLADTFEAYQKQTGDKRTTSVVFSRKLVEFGFVKVKNSARAHGEGRRGQYYFTLPDETSPTLL